MLNSSFIVIPDSFLLLGWVGQVNLHPGKIYIFSGLFLRIQFLLDERQATREKLSIKQCALLLLEHLNLPIHVPLLEQFLLPLLLLSSQARLHLSEGYQLLHLIIEIQLRKGATIHSHLCILLVAIIILNLYIYGIAWIVPVVFISHSLLILEAPNKISH